MHLPAAPRTRHQRNTSKALKLTKSTCGEINRMTLIIAQMIVLSILVLAWPAACETTFLNTFGQQVKFNCPHGHAINRFESNQIEDNGDFDREWNFDCVQVSKHIKEYCSDFSTINGAEELMLFQCPKNSYLAGIKSDYVTSMEDRVWNVKCCRVLGKCTRDCCLSPALNTLDGPMDYTPPEEGVFFVGIFSVFDSDEKDRVFYVEQCRAVQCGPPYYHKYKNPWSNKDKPPMVKE